jgi:hypothetical protein
MAEKYTYSYSEFLNEEADTSRLTIEIEDSDIVTALEYINADTNQVDLWFGTALSGAEETTLSGVIAAHTGEDYCIKLPNVFSGHNADTTQTFTSDTVINFTDIRKDILFSTETVGGGTEITVKKDGWCRIDFSISIDLTSGSTRTGSKIWLEKNGTFVPGTYSFGYHRNTATGEDSASCATDVEVVKGDVFRLKMTRQSGSGTLSTIAQGCRLRMEFLT